MDLQGFLYDDSPWRWTLEPEPTFASLQQVLERFYGQFDYEDVESFTFLGWNTDPVGPGGEPYYKQSVHIVPFRRGFYVVIEKQFREIYGPHSVTLYFKPDKEVTWVGMAQIKGMFYSDTLKEELVRVLREREFYQSPKTAAVIISI